MQRMPPCGCRQSDSRSSGAALKQATMSIVHPSTPSTLLPASPAPAAPAAPTPSLPSQPPPQRRRPLPAQPAAPRWRCSGQPIDPPAPEAGAAGALGSAAGAVREQAGAQHRAAAHLQRASSNWLASLFNQGKQAVAAPAADCPPTCSSAESLLSSTRLSSCSALRRPAASASRPLRRLVSECSPASALVSALPSRCCASSLRAGWGTRGMQNCRRNKHRPPASAQHRCRWLPASPPAAIIPPHTHDSLAVQARPLLLHDRLLRPHGAHRLCQLSILRLQRHQLPLHPDPPPLQLPPRSRLGCNLPLQIDNCGLQRACRRWWRLFRHSQVA